MCVCVCPLVQGEPEAFTRSASCRVERLVGDNNSQVKIQLFAWGLTLWVLWERSAGCEGLRASETEATYKALLLLLSPQIIKIWKPPLQDKATGQSDWVQFHLNSQCGAEQEQFMHFSNIQTWAINVG